MAVDLPLTCIPGQPLHNLPSLVNGKEKASVVISYRAPRLPSSISFVRSRMMYARAALNAQGNVRFGLRHIRWLFVPFFRCGLTLQCRCAESLPIRKASSYSKTGIWHTAFG